MIKTTLFVSLLAASASAFAPQQSSRTATALNEGFCNGYAGGDSVEPIFMAPSQNFDPAGFCEQNPDWVPWYREAELKHGRAAMLATLGMVVPEYIRIPGEQFSKEAIPRVIDAHDALPDSMIQIFGWISFVEACSFGALANMNGFDRQPGDFGFDPLKLWPSDPKKQEHLKLAELKNGRLAMIAIGGMVAGATVTGHPFPYLP